jgi:hypothetical protein
MVGVAPSASGVAIATVRTAGLELLPHNADQALYEYEV